MAAWIQAQSELTAGALASLPARDVFRERLTALFDHEHFTAPHPRDGRYFHLRQSCLKNQPTLLVREDVEGEDRVLLDPRGDCACPGCRRIAAGLA